MLIIITAVYTVHMRGTPRPVGAHNLFAIADATNRANDSMPYQHGKIAHDLGR